jgi:hypothetical protein
MIGSQNGTRVEYAKTRHAWQGYGWPQSTKNGADDMSGLTRRGFVFGVCASAAIATIPTRTAGQAVAQKTMCQKLTLEQRKALIQAVRALWNGEVRYADPQVLMNKERGG